MHFVESKAKPYALILHDLYFLFGFFGKIWVPSCTCMFKIWLNKASNKALMLRICFCYRGINIFPFTFLSIWLLHGQIWATVEGAASLT